MKRKENGKGTPAERGFRMPPEWEPHEATWLAWPHNRTDWPGKFLAIHWVFAEIARKIAGSEVVRLLVASAEQQAKAASVLTRVGADLSRVEFFRMATDRSWARDFGPIFVRRGGQRPELAVVDFNFNAWARYPDCRKDSRIASRIARKLGLSVFGAAADGAAFVLEGGAIEVNGAGSVLATEECLLDRYVQPRNPSLDRDGIEWCLQDFLGVSNVIWLGRGIAGDDTHGHVDDVCRFVNASTVVLCQEDDPHELNYVPLAENRQRLQDARLEDGSRLDVVPLPMPDPVFFDGRRLPASYANFYIANDTVLVPTFNDPKDRDALGTLAELFRGRRVVGVYAGDLVWGFGTIHCLTQQQPEFLGYCPVD